MPPAKQPDKQPGSRSKLWERLRHPRRGRDDKLQANTEKVAERSSKTSSNGVGSANSEYCLHEAPAPKPGISTTVGDEANPGNAVMSAVTGKMKPMDTQNGLDEVISPPAARAKSSTPVGAERTTTSKAPETIKHASTHKALWEKAYKELESDQTKAKYMTRYREIISRFFLDRRETSQGLGEGEMKELVAQGLKKIENNKVAMGLSENNLKVVTAVKNILDIPLKNIPQAALPWAVISSSVDILLKPVKAGADLYNGVGYVVGRIEWFSNYTDRLLSENSIGDEGSLRPIREDIETRIIDLYRSLLFYQIQSVCFFYAKSRFLFLLTRGILDLEDWSGDLQAVKDAEDRLLGDCSLYDMECLKSQVREIYIDHKTQEDIDIFSKRLQAIRHVDPATVVRSIQDRKEMPMDELYTWIFDTDSFKQFSRWEDAPRRLWISGQAGTGKTMFMIGAIKQIQTCRLLETACEEPPTVIYFFCQSTDDQLNNGTAILRSLVWMLLCQQPDLSKHLDKQFSSSGEKFVYDRNSFSTWCDILVNMLNDCGYLVIVIDAIDECEEVSRKDLKSFLDRVLHMELSHVKWLLTSRPLYELPGSLPGKIVMGHTLLHLDDCNLDSRVRLYIRRKMFDIKQKAKNKMRTADIETQLCERSSNTFIWASLVIREFQDSAEVDWKDILVQIPDDLSRLYEYLLSGLKSQRCRDVLAVAILARRPLTLSETEHLAGLETGVNAGEDCVRLCKSFLTLRSDTVYWIHQSAQDWLLEQHHRLRNESLEELHARIYRSSFEGLGTILKENVYMLPNYGVLAGEVKPPTDNPLSPIRYSCQSWVHHLRESKLAPTTDILAFLQTHFLHWLEAMALLGHLPETVQIVDELQSLNALHGDSELSKFLLDAKRFILKNIPAVTIAPLQLYVSALIFTPKASIVRGTGSLPSWIRNPPEVDGDWGFLLQTLEHPEAVLSVAFSTDDQLVVGADRESVKIWDTATGVLQREVGHKHGLHNFCSVGFSPDGQFLATGSSEGQAAIWETEKWSLTQSLLDPPVSGWIENTIFSPDSQLFACSSLDARIIKVWKKNITTWNLHWDFRPHEGGLCEGLSFSHNSLLLAAAHTSGDILIWNMKTGKIQHHIQHLSYVKTVKFSADGIFLLATSSDQGILIWNTSDWSLIHTIPPSRPHFASSFSPDSKYIAASDRASIAVFERETWVIFQILRGHHSLIANMTFSSDGRLLASCGWDNTIRLWAVGPGESASNSDDYSDFLQALTFSPDGSLVATGTQDMKVKIWDAATGHLIRTIEIGDHYVSMAKISPNNHILASGSNDGTVTVWNIQTGDFIVARDGQESYDSDPAIIDIQFSRSSRLVAACSRKNYGTVEVWSTETRDQVKSELNGKDYKGEELQQALEVLEQDLDSEQRGAPSQANIPFNSLQSAQLCQISVVGEWVMLGEQKSIWLPPEHRPYMGEWAQRNNILVIGSRGLRVLFFWFHPPSMSPEQLRAAK